MGDTKVSIKGLHEDMRIFADEVSEESKTATERVKKLGIIKRKVHSSILTVVEYHSEECKI